MTHRPPPFSISVDGEIVQVRPYSIDDTIADLARALEVPADRRLVNAGTALPPDEHLVATDIVVGSALHSSSVVHEHQSVDRGDGSDESDFPVEVAVVSGPSCQPWRALPVGRHSIGRSPDATIRLEDPTVELHHAVLDVAADTTVAIAQLTGRAPMHNETRSPGDVTLVVGASRIELRLARSPGAHDRLAGSVVDAEHDPWRRVVRRGPAATLPEDDDPIAVPEAPPAHLSPPAVGLIGAATAAAGAGVMAVVFGQALFALIALIGVAASILTWVVGVIAARRRRSRALAAHRRASDAFLIALAASNSTRERAHRARHVDVIDAMAADERFLWQQRVTGGTTAVTLGRGTVRSAVSIVDGGCLPPEALVAVERSERLVDVGVPMTLSAASVVGVRGDRAMSAAVTRSVIAQLVVAHGPADVRLTVVTDRPDVWGWAGWLPHGGPEHSAIVVAPGADLDLTAPPGGISVVITDVADLLTSRTGAFRRALDSSGAACIVVVADEPTVPALCDRVLDVGSSGCGRWSDGASINDEAIALAGITVEAAERVARRLAPMIDPEDGAGAVALPNSLELVDLDIPVDPESIVQRWQANRSEIGLAATIGMSHDGTVEIDLVRDGPHALIAGTTGSGKSELLRTLVVSLAANVSPDLLSFVLVDFKGGATFDACAALPHTVGVVTDLDAGLAERALVGLDAEIRRREHRFRRDGVDNIADARRPDEPLPRLVVIVDEFATLAKELPGFLDALISIAQRGRSLGVHLVLATQRPAGVVTDDIRANTNLRLALRLHDRSDAMDVVGDERPARFPTAIAGRALMRLGPDDVIVFQAASCTGPERVDPGRLTIDRLPGVVRPCDAARLIDTLITSIDHAAREMGVAAPHRPWTDPLPAVLRCADLGEDPSVVGIVDDPAEQRQIPLRWDRSRGNLWLAGVIGTGTTTAACTIAWSIVQATIPADCHLYVLDASGESRYDDLASSPQCGAVIRTVETERVDRLLRRLDVELDRRTDCGLRRPEVVLVVDGLGPLRTTLAPIERTESAMRLDRILREGPACGVVSCATVDDVTAHLFDGAERWEFQGPGRVRLSGSGLLAQLVADAPARVAPTGSDGGPAPILSLPDVVAPDAVDIARSCPARRMSGCTTLVIGLGADDLEPEFLDVPDGDHVFIGGPARTGVSTALRQLEHAWVVGQPHGVVVRADRTVGLDRCLLETLADSNQPVLVAVDDADRVVDPDGCLAAIISARRPGVLVIAAARLEAVRGAYGHWVREVARSRCGLIMTSVGEVDGDMLGVTLPRRPMIPPRPGLAWAIDGRGQRLVQVAARMGP